MLEFRTASARLRCLICPRLRTQPLSALFLGSPVPLLNFAYPISIERRSYTPETPSDLQASLGCLVVASCRFAPVLPTFGHETRIRLLPAFHSKGLTFTFTAVSLHDKISSHRVGKLAHTGASATRYVSKNRLLKPRLFVLFDLRQKGLCTRKVYPRGY